MTDISHINTFRTTPFTSKEGDRPGVQHVGKQNLKVKNEAATSEIERKIEKIDAFFEAFLKSEVIGKLTEATKLISTEIEHWYSPSDALYNGEWKWYTQKTFLAGRELTQDETTFCLKTAQDILKAELRGDKKAVENLTQELRNKLSISGWFSTDRYDFVAHWLYTRILGQAFRDVGETELAEAMEALGHQFKSNAITSYDLQATKNDLKKAEEKINDFTKLEQDLREKFGAGHMEWVQSPMPYQRSLSHLKKTETERAKKDKNIISQTEGALNAIKDALRSVQKPTPRSISRHLLNSKTRG